MLRLLEAEERSGVVLLSGDVHYTQFFKSPCKSRLGYSLIELCSSGLSHVLGMIAPPSDKLLGTMTPGKYALTRVEGWELNFGLVEVKSEDGDFYVKLLSKNDKGEPIFTQEFRVKRDFSFRSGAFPFKTMCEKLNS